MNPDADEPYRSTGAQEGADTKLTTHRCTLHRNDDATNVDIHLVT